jgi:hypothetical protein
MAKLGINGKSEIPVFTAVRSNVGDFRVSFSHCHDVHCGSFSATT